MRSLVLLAVAVGSLAASRTASASDCTRAWTTGPIFASDAGVTLESLDSQLECSGSRRRWSCRLRETYVVRGASTAGTPAAVYFEVETSGPAESSIEDGDLTKCMAEAIKRWKFPKPEGGAAVTVSYPFVLEPGD